MKNKKMLAKYIISNSKEINYIIESLNCSSDNKEYPIILTSKQKKILYDYITNLKQQLRATETNEETFKLEMQEITKIFGLDKDTLFDDVKNYARVLKHDSDKLSKIENEFTNFYTDYF